MNKFVTYLLITSILTGCSSTGGIYSENDPNNSEFSAGRTILSVVGAVGVVLGAKALSKNGGGSSYAGNSYAWDYQPGNGQWVCRNTSNGQYAYKSNCEGLAYIDNWP